MPTVVPAMTADACPRCGEPRARTPPGIVLAEVLDVIRASVARLHEALSPAAPP